MINTPTYNDPSSKLCIHVLFSSKIAKKANFVGCCNRLNLRLSYNLLGRFYIAMSCHVPTVTVIAVICGSQSPSWKVDTVRSLALSTLLEALDKMTNRLFAATISSHAALLDVVHFRGLSLIHI